MMGKKNILSSTKYEKCIEAEFDICKAGNQYEPAGSYITEDEEREIIRWLNRREFLQFQLLSERYRDIYFDGSFNVSRIEYYGNVVGMHLSFTGSQPFGYSYFSRSYEVKDRKPCTIYDASDEIGYSYLDTTITCHEKGDLIITNQFDERKTIIKNCASGEVITMKDGIVITSSNEDHNNSIMNDFNFNFPMVSNSYTNRKNVYTFNRYCSVRFEYKIIRKVGV
jgi:hypothetical protein